MKFAIYETHMVCRRIVTEADSEAEARCNWEQDVDCEVDPYFSEDYGDYKIDAVEMIEEDLW